MRFLITHITAAALVLHLSLGCCAHHVHAGESVITDQQQAQCDDCHEHGHEDEPVDSHDETPHSSCDEQDCSFVSSAKISLPQSNWVTPVAVIDTDLPGSTPAGSAADRAALHHAPFSGLPLRAHLLFQVFLI